jgi:DNA-binding protein H-NS
MKTTNTLKLKARIAILQKKLALAEKSKEPAIRKVVALMKKLGVTPSDLTAATGTTLKTGNRIVRSSGRRGPAPIKYKDDSGNRWSGRGKTPRWIVAAEKAGKKRESFLV